MEAKISHKGWVVIPAALRKKYKLNPGVQVRMVDYGGVLAIVPMSEDPIGYGAGMLAGSHSLSNMMIAEHQQELDDEAHPDGDSV